MNEVLFVLTGIESCNYLNNEWYVNFGLVKHIFHCIDTSNFVLWSPETNIKEENYIKTVLIWQAMKLHKINLASVPEKEMTVRIYPECPWTTIRMYVDE